MEVDVLVQGLAIGFSIAAPVGAIGVLCIRRTLAHERAVGFVTGLGAATADASYGAIAAFGLAAVSDWLIEYQRPIHVAGGLFLCLHGVRTFRAVPPLDTGAAGTPRWPVAYLSTVALTLTNPSTIVSFAAIFSGTGLERLDRGSATVLVVGVFLGSAVWWLLLSSGVGIFRSQVTPARLRWVNRVSGMLIFALGAVAMVT